MLLIDHRFFATVSIFLQPIFISEKFLVPSVLMVQKYSMKIQFFVVLFYYILKIFFIQCFYVGFLFADRLVVVSINYNFIMGLR